jgi:hypothetical protein
MRSRFVKPEVTILSLSEGDSLTVRKRLTHGELQDAYARMYIAGLNGDLKMDARKYGDAMICAYLVDWTFRDEAGAVIPIRGLAPADLSAVLRDLDPLDWVEVRQAIEAHDAAMAEARTQEKKHPDGATASSATWPSVA